MLPATPTWIGEPGSAVNPSFVASRSRIETVSEP